MGRVFLLREKGGGALDFSSFLAKDALRKRRGSPVGRGRNFLFRNRILPGKKIGDPGQQKKKKKKEGRENLPFYGGHPLPGGEDGEKGGKKIPRPRMSIPKKERGKEKTTEERKKRGKGEWEEGSPLHSCRGTFM